MAYPMDPVPDYYTLLKEDLTALPELQNHQPGKSFEQNHAEVILNRFKPQAEEIIAEKHAGFRVARSTIEQFFNLRLLYEKFLQQQQNLYHVFIDFKKAFDRKWHLALWDGLMICDFTFFSTVFQSYQYDGRMIMKFCEQWNPVYG